MNVETTVPASEIPLPTVLTIAPNVNFNEDELDAALHQLVRMHPINNKEKQNSDNKSKKNDRRFPSRIDVGEKIFGNIQLDELAEFYMSVLAHVPKFKACNSYDRWLLNTGFGIDHILIQSFFTWLDRREKIWKDGQRFARKLEREEDFRPSNPSPPRSNFPAIGSSTPAVSILPKKPKRDFSTRNQSKYANLQRICFSYGMRLKIIKQLIPIAFPYDAGHSIWKLVFSVLEIKNQGGLYPEFVNRLVEAAGEGKASFNALEFYLSQPNNTMSVTSPRLILQTVLLGPLRTTVLENFIQNRSPQFKEEAKQLLIKAENWAKNETEFNKAVQEFAHTNPSNVPPFHQFCLNFGALMAELRREPPKNNVIPESWAIKSLKNSFRRTFRNSPNTNSYSRHEVPWTIDQLKDLIHTVLVQRPSLKHMILRLCNEFNCNDNNFLHHCRSFNSSNRTKMPKGEKTSYYTDENGEFLSLPRTAVVFFVDTEHKMKIMQEDLDKYIRAEQNPILALDAEWNPYVQLTRANILQLTFQNSIYILDMDALGQKRTMIDFLDNVFLSKKLLKLGYQFGEDLYQISLSVKNCIGLYKPEALICVGKLVSQLIAESQRQHNFPIEEFLRPVSGNEADNKEKMEEYDGAQMDNSFELVFFNYKGLHKNINCFGPVEHFQMEIGSTLDDSPNTSTLSAEMGQSPSQVSSTIQNELPVKRIIINNKDDSIKNWGLSTLCQRILGKGLDKQEQCSVWDRRPLRDRQIRYASLDAYCLLLIYQRCQEWSQRLNVDLNHLIYMQGKTIIALPLFWEPITSDS